MNSKTSFGCYGESNFLNFSMSSKNKQINFPRDMCPSPGHCHTASFWLLLALIWHPGNMGTWEQVWAVQVETNVVINCRCFAYHEHLLTANWLTVQKCCALIQWGNSLNWSPAYRNWFSPKLKKKKIAVLMACSSTCSTDLNDIIERVWLRCRSYQTHLLWKQAQEK